MNVEQKDQHIVLAAAPCSHGIGYVVFKGPQIIVEWGMRYVLKDKNRNALTKIKDLVEAHQPDILVIEDYTGHRSRRAPRIRSLIRSIDRYAQEQAIEVHRFSRGDIRDCFQAFRARTKHQIATKISTWWPEMKRLLPPKRTPWESERARMAAFDATALGVTYFDGASHSDEVATK